MKQKSLIIVVLIAAALIIGTLIWTRSSPTPAPAAPDSSQATTSVGTVVISAAQMAMSGIAVQTLPLSQFQSHTSAYASVLDPGPLLQLRGQLHAAQLQADAARAQVVASAREYQRLAVLNGQSHTVSDKVTEAALASRDADRAHLAAAQASLVAARDAARSRWGDVLVGWASAAHSSQLNALNGGQQVLLSVALPNNETADTPPSIIHLGQSAGSAAQIIAHLVSPSPLADSLIQSPAYFYLAPHTGLRSGMHLEAFLPTGQQQTGVIIPDAAVVWYANRPWVYVQTDATHFVRREISVDTPATGGWFVTHWQGGERVVVKGAALLFSQEFQPKPQAAGSGDGGDGD